MEGCRGVTWNNRSILCGQPPEVVKALINSNLRNLDTLVLPDVRERQGILLNNLEFPFYYFLFVAGGLAEGRRLNIVGNEDDIHQALALLRLALLGETHEVMTTWTLEEAIKQDIHNASSLFAIKDEKGNIREIDTFFHICPFNDNCRPQKCDLLLHGPLFES